MNNLLVAFAAVACSGGFAIAGEQPAPSAVYTAVQAEAGRAAYRSSCAKCHTDTLVGHDGTGEIPEFLRQYSGMIPPLAGANAAFPPFLTRWGPKTTKALKERIEVAVGGFPPPGRRRDDELYLDLTAYVLQVNGARPGTEALTASTAVEIRTIAPGAAAPTTTPAPKPHVD